MPFCINCGREAEERFEFCPECGAKIITEVPDDEIDYTYNQNSINDFRNFQTAQGFKKCPNCGNAMSLNAMYCSGCAYNFVAGTINPINSINNDGKDKNKWVAFILCLLLGIFGAHKFYEGKIGLGILYIFTLGLFGIGVLIDLIVILCRPTWYGTKK